MPFEIASPSARNDIAGAESYDFTSSRGGVRPKKGIAGGRRRYCLFIRHLTFVPFVTWLRTVKARTGVGLKAMFVNLSFVVRRLSLANDK